MDATLIIAFLLISLVSAVASIFLVFKVSDFKTMTKIVVLRGIVKVVVGLLAGLLWSVYVNDNSPNPSMLIISIIITFLLAGIVSLFSNKWLLNKLFALDYSVTKVLSAHVADFSIAFMLSFGLIVIFEIQGLS